MNEFKISQYDFSELFWRRIFNGSRDVMFRQVELQRALLQQDNLRPKADYNTGSINFNGAWSLYSIVSYFLPKNVAEIGTFIGKSTISMALALDNASRPGKIQTCDISNGFDLNWEGETDIVQNFKTSSTDMLLKIDTPQDLLFVDGRLSNEDISILQTPNYSSCVFVFDDTEGVEKGFVNQFHLSQKLTERFFIYPPSSEVLKQQNLYGNCNVSLSIPMSILKFVRQG